MSLTTAACQETNTDAFAAVFPLPVSTIEAFMLADTTPAYPMMCDLSLNFSGRIDRAAFDTGLAIAVARAPLFRSLIEMRPKGGPRWVLTNRQPKVDWAPWGTPYGEDYDTQIDLTDELPLRVYVRQGDENSEVLLHFHHASADALGAYGFVEDFLAGYANAFSGRNPVELRPLAPERLLTRGATGAENRGVYRGFVDALIGIREGIRFFCQKPLALSPVLPPATTEKPVRQQVGYVCETCPEEVAAGLRSVAAANKVNINDLLLRDLYITMQSWLKGRGQSVGNRQFRILMPQNLRERADRATPTTNMVGFAFVTRRASWCSRPQELLASIHEETEAVFRGQLSRYFIGGLAALHSAGMLDRVLRSSLCFASSVLTNLGNPQRRFVTRLPRSGDGLVAGNLVFNGLTGVPPLRARTAAAFCVMAHGSSYVLNLKCDSYAYSREETQQLLQAYLGQLAKTARGEN